MDDTGPWVVLTDSSVKPSRILVEDSDHNVLLLVMSDFQDEKQEIAYAEELCRKLNSQ